MSQLTSKVCCVCKQEKPIDAFCFENRNLNHRSGACRVCHSKRVAKWQKANPLSRQKTRKKHGQKYNLKRKFGITPDDYKQMLKKQSGCCAICSFPQNGRCLDVDHDHKTGKLRGLLCRRCNLGIGKFKDNLILLDVASMYLYRGGFEATYEPVN